MNGEQAAAAPAADSPSIEQRAAAIFGDATAQQPPKQKQPPQAPQQAAEQGNDEQTDQAPNPEDATSDAPPDGESESTAPQFEEVEYEGELYQVPPKLKEAIIRQADYTKKTQAVAEKERLIAHREQQLRTAELNRSFQESVQPQLAELAQIDSQLSQYDKVDWRAIPADERTLHMLEMQRLEKVRDAKQREIEGKKAEHSQKFQEQMAQLQAEAVKVLKGRIPNWSDNTAKEVRDWAIGNGFTSEEVSSIYDPRHAEVLWKAAQYDKARNSAKPAVSQAKAAKPSSSNPMPQQVKDKLNFRKALAKVPPNSPERRRLVEDRAAQLFK